MQFIHHDDALFDRTNLGAFSATDAILILDVIEAVAGRIEALVGAFGPAEGALGAEIESDRRSLRLGGAALEARISILPPGADLEAALYRGNHGSFLHLEPFGQHRYLMRPLDSIRRSNRSDSRRLGLLPQGFVRCARRIRPALVLGLFQQISLDSLDAD